MVLCSIINISKAVCYSYFRSSFHSFRKCIEYELFVFIQHERNIKLNLKTVWGSERPREVVKGKGKGKDKDKDRILSRRSQQGNISSWRDMVHKTKSHKGNNSSRSCIECTLVECCMVEADSCNRKSCRKGRKGRDRDTCTRILYYVSCQPLSCQNYSWERVTSWLCHNLAQSCRNCSVEVAYQL